MDICKGCQHRSLDGKGACVSEPDCRCGLCGELDPGKGAATGCGECRRFLAEQAAEAEIAAGWDATP